MPAAKTLKALEVGLVPVLCVGETLEERKSGQMDAVLAGQINAVIELCGADTFGQIIVAYEPVWAIGTGVVAEPHQVQAMHEMIRSVVSNLGMSGEEILILYGGSVKPENANGLFALDDVDGALVGGASLDSEAFLAIIEAARSAKAA